MLRCRFGLLLWLSFLAATRLSLPTTTANSHNATSHTCTNTSSFFDTRACNLVAVCLATANPRVPMLTAGKFTHVEHTHNHNFNICNCTYYELRFLKHARTNDKQRSTITTRLSEGRKMRLQPPSTVSQLPGIVQIQTSRQITVSGNPCAAMTTSASGASGIALTLPSASVAIAGAKCNYTCPALVRSCQASRGIVQHSP
jgi:hypothetical protein